VDQLSGNAAVNGVSVRLSAAAAETLKAM